jgi:hypothetical protein
LLSVAISKTANVGPKDCEVFGVSRDDTIIDEEDSKVHDERREEQEKEDMT